MKDLIAGLFIIVFASLFLVPGLEYGVGSFNRPGSGGIPVVAAIVMIGLGVAVGLVGIRQRSAESQAISFNIQRVRHISLVSAAIAGFALSIEWLGLIPATVIVVVLSALADHRSRIIPTLGLATVISVLICLIFKLGLSSSVPLIKGLF